MKNISVILFTLTVIFAVPSYGETMDELVYREDTYYAKFTDVPFSGEITGMFQGMIKDGKKEGLWREYHSNGQLVVKANYTNNELDGAFVSYSSRGSMLGKGSYKRGKKEGLWEEDGETGKYKNGKKEGLWEGYGETGKYKNGNKEGLWIIRSISGFDTPQFETVNFIDGLKEGKFVTHYGGSSGQIASKGNYKNGSLNGEFVSYHESGKIWKQGSYKNGCATGLWSYRNIKGELYHPDISNKWGEDSAESQWFDPFGRCDEYEKVRFAQ